MSSIENVVNEVEVKVRVKAKAFAQKDKKTMFSILGFMLYLKEQGVLEDDKVKECMESLPLYKTAAEKTAFFELDVFDTKRVEDEIYKPMVLENKNNKKQEKKEKRIEPKEKKPREKKPVVEGEKVKKPRVKKVVSEAVSEPEKEKKIKKPRAKKVVVVSEPLVSEPEPVSVSEPLVSEPEPVAEPEPVSESEKEPEEKKTKKPRAKKDKVEGDETQKRGRKPKQQVVEFAQENPSSLQEEKDPLDILVESMNTMSLSPALELEGIQVEDIDDMLKELEAEEMVVECERVQTPILKEKKEKKKKVVTTVSKD